MRWVWRVVRFLVAAVVVYAMFVALVLTINMAEGGGISCYEVCSPSQRYMSDHTWPSILAIALSLIAGAFAALDSPRRRRRGR